MRWIRFDIDDVSTWPKDDRLKLIRWVDYYGAEHYDVTKWYVVDKPIWGPRVWKMDRHEDIRLNSDYYEAKHDSTLLTHWCLIDDKPNDGYWESYKHENGNTYADKEWLRGIPKGPAGRKFYELYKSAKPLVEEELI